MNILSGINILKNKILLLGCLGFFISMSGITSAVLITMKEKDLVVRELADCLENDVTFMSDIPKYQEIGMIAKKFREAWELATGKGRVLELLDHTILGNLQSPIGWATAARTEDRDEFKREINDILSQMFSHIYIDDAKESLVKEFFDHEKELGITYRESRIKSPYQEYVVTDVRKGSIAAGKNIQVGDRFVLCTHNTIPLIRTKINDDTIKKVQGVRFARNGQRLGDLRLTFTHKIEYGDSIYHYEWNKECFDEVKSKFNSKFFTPKHLSLKVGSFMPGEYPGNRVSTVLQFAIDNGFKGVVIDLRGNLGGAVANLNHLLSFFIAPHVPYGITVTRKAWEDLLKSDTICQDIREDAIQAKKLIHSLFFECIPPFFEEKYPELLNRVPLDETTGNRQLFTGKVAILIDENTASAAEDCTIALRELLGDQCRVFGRKSAGKLLTVSNPCYVGSFKIVYPSQDVLSIKGTRVEGKGIEPDTIVPENDDVALKEILKLWFDS